MISAALLTLHRGVVGLRHSGFARRSDVWRRSLALHVVESNSGVKTVSQALQQAASFSSGGANSTTSGVGFKKPNAAVPQSVDLKGLKQEVSRAILRTFKKVGKANERLSKAEEEYAAVMATPSIDIDQARLAACPDPDEFKEQLNTLQNNLARLRDLEEALKSIKPSSGSGSGSGSSPQLQALIETAAELGVSDSPPPLPERGPKKPKGTPAPPRMPYHVHTSVDGVEVRVGRGASDNDELSCNPVHRDGSDWWLHVAGFPGSHVVIRSGDDEFPSRLPETLRDAAVLAAVNSKAAAAGGKVLVSFCRCRDVSKPSGAKAGLVRLSGNVGSVSIDIKAERKRLERLNAHKAGSAPEGGDRA